MISARRSKPSLQVDTSTARPPPRDATTELPAREATAIEIQLPDGRPLDVTPRGATLRDHDDNQIPLTPSPVAANAAAVANYSDLCIGRVIGQGSQAAVRE
eukprot:RCo026893